jgi:hypothetical protein
VARSEMLTGHRNSAIAHGLAEHHRLINGIDKVLAQYCAQCAITATATTVAKAALFLADRDTTTAPLDAATIRRANAVLLTSGMYGAAGDIAYRIGLPAKSGIGGGVLAVMPGKGTVCVWSPPLDADGNSAGGVAAIEEFARLAGGSVSDNSQPQRRCWPSQDESTYRFYTWAQLPVSIPMPNDRSHAGRAWQLRRPAVSASPTSRLVRALIAAVSNSGPEDDARLFA